MDNLKEDSINYNDEPVYFCKKCLSLKVMVLGEQFEYCDECGNTDIGTSHIDEWKELYHNKYGENYIK